MKRPRTPCMMRAVWRLVVLVGGVGLVGGLFGCPRPAPSAEAGASDAASPGTFDDRQRLDVALAEDNRRARDVAPEIRTSHDPAARRRSARALARIADAASLEGLAAHLADDDPETMTWAAYGLGYACKGHEDAHVKMLAARSASVTSSDAGTGKSAVRGVPELDARTALARAIGRCGGVLAESALVALLKTGATWQGAALLGLGDLATRRKQIAAETMTVLLEIVDRDGDAFYALSRAEAGDAFGKRVADAARAALARPGDARILAIKTLGRAGRDLAKDTAPALLDVVTDAKRFTPVERAEAARSLGALFEPGQATAAEALGRLAPDKDPVAIQGLLGPEFQVLLGLVGAVGAEPSKKAEAPLRAIFNLSAPAAPKVALARRLAELRCAAALGLARGIYDAEVLKKCDVETSEISQQARLTSLLRRPLTTERKAVFRAFTHSEHVRIREAAVAALAQHPELRDGAAAILAEALGSKKAGLVATAAELINGHPDRAQVLAESERRAALDPRAPPPTSDPAQELSRDVAKALGDALAEKWPEDRFETRIALIEAAAAVRHPLAKEVATAACNDPNVVVRERAQKALRALGEKVPGILEREKRPAAEIGHTVTAPQKVVLTLDAELAPLTIVLEPELAPVTATRLASLVKSGFYKGIVVHRVAPGFVAQFGDPGGDGFGGSGTSLRCETSPVPFATLDVGMALAGRDTGSSQLFVTLARAPHLDGEYTRVGRAEGPWSSVAQGDVIVDAKLVE